MVKPKKREEAEQRRLNAYHEAGHAAMLFFFGTHDDFLGIDMRRTNHRSGMMRHKDSYPPDRVSSWLPTNSRMAKLTAIRSIMLSMAGPAAENAAGKKDRLETWYARLWELEPFAEDADVPYTDLEKSISAAKALHGPAGRKWRRFLLNSARWAEEAILLPRLWTAVDSLAAQLIPVQTMGQKKAWSIMESAYGVDTMPFMQSGAKWRRRLAVETET